MRWGIVGTGAIAAHFALALSRVPGAIRSAVASRREETGAAFARSFGFGAVAEGAAALAARDDVDIVYVATPNHAHVEDCLAVIAAGKSVLCEKPLATTAADARRIVDAARASGVFAMEGLWSLCTPAWTAALADVADGRIGRLEMFQASFAVAQSPATMPRLFEAAAGGGALLDRGVYLLALAQAALGELSLVQAQGRKGADGTDLDVALLLRNADGAQAMLDAAIDRLGANTAVLSGSHGRMVASEPVNAPRSITITRRDPAAAFHRPTGMPGLKTRLLGGVKANRRVRQLHAAFGGGARWFSNGLEDEIVEVERCVAAGLRESPRVPLDLSVRTLALIDQARALL